MPGFPSHPSQFPAENEILNGRGVPLERIPRGRGVFHDRQDGEWNFSRLVLNIYDPIHHPGVSYIKIERRAWNFRKKSGNVARKEEKQFSLGMIALSFNIISQRELFTKQLCYFPPTTVTLIVKRSSGKA